MPTLVSDLALIMIVAGITTLLFKWLKQPVVLGYIVAGFLVGPYSHFFPTVVDEHNIDVWAQIGIIFLLFSLGLEFSFKKLLNVGGSAIITATIIVLGMMFVGYSTGLLLGFEPLDSLFLGGMLSMSSTTIIIKAFSDLNLRKQQFTTLVFGVLVVEDLFAIVMMVILSSIAVNQAFEGGQLVYNMVRLLFFLISWFLIGIFVIPTLLKKVRKFLNSETLLILSLGMCLGMVVLANYAGFSAALGAFVMGSILAGTNQAENIEKVMFSVKDFFGAVFFISVGMLVNPETLVNYASPILILSFVVICGQIFFATTGLIISGQPLQIAIRSGFSLSQIGEFAFIIATLGMSLKVIDSSLYPIVVAVSVITTFTTPYFIKMAVPANKWIEKRLPENYKFLINRYSRNASTMQTTNIWKYVFKVYRWQILLYSVVLAGIAISSLQWFTPLMHIYFSGKTADIVSTVVTLLTMAPFIWGLIIRRIKSEEVMLNNTSDRSAQMPILVMFVVRLVLSLGFVTYFLAGIYSKRIGLLIALVVFLIVLFLFAKRFQEHFFKIEKRFLDNLNERELRRTGKKNNVVNNIHIAHMDVSGNCPFIGKRLADSNIHKDYGVNIVSIRRGGRVMNIPDGNSRIFPGDVVGVVGSDREIQRFLPVVEQEEIPADTVKRKVTVEKVLVTDDSSLLGITLSQSGIREKANCLVVGIERADGQFVSPTAQFVFKSGDLVWLVGEKENITLLLTDYFART